MSTQLGTTTIAQFRNRGVQAILSSRLGRWNYGVGAGYDQRRLLVPATSVLAPLRGVTDEGYYLFVAAGRPIDALSDISLVAYFSQYDNGAPPSQNVRAAGLSAAYSRRFWRRLTGTAAGSLNAFDQDGFDSQLIASALLGLRYNF